jgi:uncharacterized membrane protein
MTHIHRPRRRSGSAAIEFAIWLPVLLMFVATVVDYGFYMTERVAVARATMEGTRTGAAIFEPNNVVPGSLIGPAAQSRASDILTQLGITCPSANCVINVTYCPAGDGACGNAPFDAIQVEITSQFRPLFGLIPTPHRLDEKLIMAVENQRSS